MDAIAGSGGVFWFNLISEYEEIKPFEKAYYCFRSRTGRFKRQGFFVKNVPLKS